MDGGEDNMNARRLAAVLVENGLTQKEAAKRIGLSANSFSARMAGKRPFNTDEVQKLCKLLRIEAPQDKVEIFLS